MLTIGDGVTVTDLVLLQQTDRDLDWKLQIVGWIFLSLKSLTTAGHSEGGLQSWNLLQTDLRRISLI